MNPAAVVPHGRGEAGSVLLETVVALSLLAMVFAGLCQVMAASAVRRQQVEARRYALMTARSTLAGVGFATPLSPGSVEGADGAYRWRVDMQPCGSGPSGAGVLYCVRVSVLGQEGPPLVSLSTRRLAPRA